MKLSILLLTVLLLAVLLYGCGADNKEGILSGTGSVAGFTNVGDDSCVQCHSAVLDPLTGKGIISQYDMNSPHKDSPYANTGNGCEACHGGGSEHHGVGQIPYPNPYADDGTRCAVCHTGKYQTNAPTKFATSMHGTVEIETGGSCRRCHTHEGAVLSAESGLTGSGDVMDNAIYQGQTPLQTEFSAFECATCHQHGGGLRSVKARDAVGNVVNWNPSKSNMMNDQFNLCTSCHTLKSYDGSKVLASGNIVTYNTFTVATDKVGHHETSWYRIIATTHLNNADNPTAGGITGYVVRIPKTAPDAYDNTTNPNAKPCFDCHGHEWKTNTAKSNPAVTTGSRAYDSANETIWTEWAKSGHAGQLLKVKEAAVGTSTGTGAVDTAMTTLVNDTTAAAWNHYDWSNGTVGSSNRQDCQRCHTATGASNYLNGPATYDKTKNDFQHLAGWSLSSDPTNRKSNQREMLYCWGCHSNVEADKGGLRNPGVITAEYKFNGALAVFPDVESSNVCIACHSGRASGETIISLPTASFTNVSFQNSHYMAAAGLMYNKIGFIAFIDPTTVIGTTTYGTSLTSCDDNANATGCINSTHRKFGSAAMVGDHGITETDTQFLSGGPCVTCHMTKINDMRHHTLEIDANAFNNVCIKCHDEENGTPLTDSNFDTVFLEEQEDVFQNALDVALSILSTKYHITFNSAVYPYFYDSDAAGGAVKNWTRPVALPGAGGTVLSDADAMKLMGACFNINLLKREPGAFAHARTYTRRLIYDTIDFLDDLTINQTTVASAVAVDATNYVVGADAKDAATTESVKYLKKYNRTSGAWDTTQERP